MKPFSGSDFYQIDTLLTEDEKMIRDTVRDFVSKEVINVPNFRLITIGETQPTSYDLVLS